MKLDKPLVFMCLSPLGNLYTGRQEVGGGRKQLGRQKGCRLLYYLKKRTDELDSHRGSFISSQANIAGSSEYLTPLYEFFLVMIACMHRAEKQNRLTVPKKLLFRSSYL